jgi:Cu-processing system permease protein
MGNPADAFRLFNLAASGATAAAAGVAGAAGFVSAWQALGLILLWPIAAFALAIATFRKITP